MPSVATHFDFVSDSLAGRGAAGFKPFGESQYGAVLIGGQGSDPFYAYGRLPWRKRPNPDRAQAFADFIHGSDPVEVFPPLAAQVVAERGEGKEVLAAYVYGLFLHYLLDRAVHPYVYYRTGFDGTGNPTGVYSYDHIRFETALAAALRRRRGESPDLPRMSFADPSTASAVGELFARTFPGRAEAGDYPAALADFAAVLRLVRDPHGIKGTLLDLFGVSSPLRAMMRPDRPSLGDRIDYANEKRTLWMRPSDGRPSGASVQALYDEALGEADRLGAFVEGALIDGASLEEWKAALGGIDHEGRGRGDVMRYFRSVYRPGDARHPAGL